METRSILRRPKQPDIGTHIRKKPNIYSNESSFYKNRTPAEANYLKTDDKITLNASNPNIEIQLVVGRSTNDKTNVTLTKDRRIVKISENNRIMETNCPENSNESSPPACGRKTTIRSIFKRFGQLAINTDLDKSSSENGKSAADDKRDEIGRTLNECIAKVKNRPNKKAVDIRTPCITKIKVRSIFKRGKLPTISAHLKEKAVNVDSNKNCFHRRGSFTETHPILRRPKPLSSNSDTDKIFNNATKNKNDYGNQEIRKEHVEKKSFYKPPEDLDKQSKSTSQNCNTPDHKSEKKKKTKRRKKNKINKNNVQSKATSPPLVINTSAANCLKSDGELLLQYWMFVDQKGFRGFRELDQ